MHQYPAQCQRSKLTPKILMRRVLLNLGKLWGLWYPWEYMTPGSTDLNHLVVISRSEVIIMRFSIDFWFVKLISSMARCFSDTLMRYCSIARQFYGRNILLADTKYRVSHIRCSTARHERGCAACPRHEQGKVTLRRLVAVKTDKLFRAFSLSPSSGKTTWSLDV
jgi:hypothetical protein